MSSIAGSKESQRIEYGSCCVFMIILPFAPLFITHEIDYVFNDIKLLSQA